MWMLWDRETGRRNRKYPGQPWLTSQFCLEIHRRSQGWIQRCPHSPLLFQIPHTKFYHSRSSQQGTLNPFASLIDADNRKLHVGFLGRVLGLSQAGCLSQDESPEGQVKTEESQLLCFLTLFTDLLGPISFHPQHSLTPSPNPTPI